MKKKQMMAVLLFAMMSVSITACGDEKKADETVVMSEEEKEDLSNFEGTWFPAEDSDFDYMTIDKEGNWELYAADQMVMNGTMEYAQKDDCFYVYCEQDGMESNAYLNEDGSFSFDALGNFSTDEGEDRTEEENSLVNFIGYSDIWYEDGLLDGYAILLDEKGIWEHYDSMGMISSGTFEVDSETNDRLLLLDEEGKKAAAVKVDDANLMSIEVYNEDVIKCTDGCTLYCESESR